MKTIISIAAFGAYAFLALFTPHTVLGLGSRESDESLRQRLNEVTECVGHCGRWDRDGLRCVYDRNSGRTSETYSLRRGSRTVTAHRCVCASGYVQEGVYDDDTPRCITTREACAQDCGRWAAGSCVFDRSDGRRSEVYASPAGSIGTARRCVCSGDYIQEGAYEDGTPQCVSAGATAPAMGKVASCRSVCGAVVDSYIRRQEKAFKGRVVVSPLGAQDAEDDCASECGACDAECWSAGQVCAARKDPSGIIVHFIFETDGETSVPRGCADP